MSPKTTRAVLSQNKKKKKLNKKGQEVGISCCSQPWELRSRKIWWPVAQEASRSRSVNLSCSRASIPKPPKGLYSGLCLSPGELPRVCRIFYQPPPQKKILIIPFIFSRFPRQRKPAVEEDTRCAQSQAAAGVELDPAWEGDWVWAKPQTGRGGRTWLCTCVLLHPGVSVT